MKEYSGIMFTLYLLLFSHKIVSDSLCPPWTIAHQAPLSMGISQARILGGLSFPPPGYLPDPGTEPASSALAGRFFTTEPPEKTGFTEVSQFVSAWNAYTPGTIWVPLQVTEINRRWTTPLTVQMEDRHSHP